jgi:MarR family transcriptional regulator, temperature-dependent positive regulator of motility
LLPAFTRAMIASSRSRTSDFAPITLVDEHRDVNARWAECSPVEISVMRYINSNPGTSARSASEATLLPSSNFSRVLRGLEQRGLVRRDVDERDARAARLYPTDKADKSLQALRENWHQTLGGIIDDPAALDLVNATLRRIENELVARRRSGRDRRTHSD